MRRIARRPAILRPVLAAREDLDEWRVGLAAAAQLRATFPDFWREHVACRPVTLTSLLNVGSALIAKADEVVELLDWYTDEMYLGWAQGDPVGLLDLTDDTRPLTVNGDDHWQILDRFIDRPPLMVYGLDATADEGELEQFGPLAAALTTMTGHLPFDLGDLGAVLGLERTNGPRDPRASGLRMLHDVILFDLPRINTQAGALAMLIDAVAETTVDGARAPLGTLLAYAHQRTGNFFADTGYWEADDMRAYGAWGIGPAYGQSLHELGAQQQAAREIADAFWRLDDLITSDPTRLLPIAQAIETAARDLGLHVYEPGEDDEADLSNNNPEDLDEDDDDDELYEDDEPAPALAAA